MVTCFHAGTANLSHQPLLPSICELAVEGRPDRFYAAERLLTLVRPGNNLVLVLQRAPCLPLDGRVSEASQLHQNLIGESPLKKEVALSILIHG